MALSAFLAAESCYQLCVNLADGNIAMAIFRTGTMAIFTMLGLHTAHLMTIR